MAGNAQGTGRSDQRRLFWWRNFPMYCWDRTPRHRLDDRSLGYRNQCGDLPERIQPRHAFYSVYSRRHFKSGRGAIDRVWPVRFWAVRHLFWVERFAARGLVHTGSDDFASHYYRERRIAARRTQRTARRLAGTWRDELANHQEECSALCDAWHFDLFNPRYCPCRW